MRARAVLERPAGMAALQNRAGYVETVRADIFAWLESVRCSEEDWGRWKNNSSMTRPWALQASGIAIYLLDRLGSLASVAAADRASAIRFFQSCQDPVDRLFKDPLETGATREGHHSWEEIWAQRNGATLRALRALGASPRLAPPTVQFADLGRVDGREWTLSLNWSNPWSTGERWSRAIEAHLRELPAEARRDANPVLADMFATLESEVLDPATGMPTHRGCSDDPARAMAGLFKIMNGYLAVGRPLPDAEAAIDSTLNLQHASGEFGYPRNMCMNWDALWILRELDIQLRERHRHGEIVKAGRRLSECLLREYRKPDGGFAFHGDHCQVNHHSVRLCAEPLPISDMLGTMMCLECLEYVDQWAPFPIAQRASDEEEIHIASC